MSSAVTLASTAPRGCLEKQLENWVFRSGLMKLLILVFQGKCDPRRHQSANSICGDK